MGSIERNQVDVVFTGYFVKDYESESSEFTATLYEDEVCVAVKKAKRIPPSLLPLVIFEELLWLSLLGAFILIFMFSSIMRYSLKRQIKRLYTYSEFPEDAEFLANKNMFNLTNHLARQSNYYQLIELFVDTLILLVSAPMRRFTRSQNERIFITSVCMFSMIFVSIYQSSLATVFIKPIYYKDINSLEQLDESGIPIVVKYVGFLTDTFPENSSRKDQSLHDKMRLYNGTTAALALVNLTEIATITRKVTVKLDNTEYFEKKQLHLVPECPRKYNLAYVVRKHSPFLERFNSLILDIQRYGLINKWIADINFKASLKNLKLYEGQFQATTKVLTMHDLQAPFYALAAGAFTSLMVFLCELIFQMFRWVYKS